ncbi:MAG: BatD family protein [Pseudomonadales bacterium]|nr:BatD family protein [Pseudomonadales bacterium]
MIRPIGKFISLVILLMLANIATAQLTVSVDRDQISMVDFLRLSIRVGNATTTLNPNFSAIEKDFEIRSVSGPNQSTRMSIINGRTSSEASTSWELTLRPKRLGRLIIPGFKLAGDTSQPILIDVTPQSAAMKQRANQLVFFNTTVSTNQLYVQSQLIYTVKLFYQDNISGDFPAPPEIPDTVVEALDKDQRYATTVQGRRYNVLEKRYAIFPQKSGKMVIPSQIFEGSKGGRGFFSNRERVNSASQSHTITINPKAAEFSGTNWLAAKNLQLSQSWSITPPTFVVGEPINRALTIQAEGLIDSLLPQLDDLSISGAKTYTDPAKEVQQSSSTGLFSTSVTTTGIVPTQPGSLTIPEIRIPWWNTETNAEEIAIIPTTTYNVAASPSQSTNQLEPVNNSASMNNDALNHSLKSVANSQAINAQANDANPQPHLWMILSAILALFWLITLGLWWRHSRQTKSNQTQPAQFEANNASQLFQQLKKACQQNNPRQANQLLFLWAKHQYPTINSTSDLIRLVQHDALADEIRQLDACLYASPENQPTNNDTWQGKQLLHCVDELSGVDKLSVLKNKRAKPTQLLHQLNPA